MTIFESWQDQLLLRLKENEFDGIFFRNYYGELITHESGFEIIDGKIFVFQETTLGHLFSYVFRGALYSVSGLGGSFALP